MFGADQGLFDICRQKTVIYSIRSFCKGGEKLMKKIIALTVAVAFVVSLAGMVFGRTMVEERDAVRAYLKVIDAKIIKYRKAGNTAKMKGLQADKAATLRRWEKLKASMVSPMTPPPAPVAPVPPSAPVVSQAAAPAGLFGMGINTSLAGLYINTGKGAASGSVGVMGNLVLDDFIGLGSMVGLSADAVKFKVGTGYVYGGGGLKAVPVYAGGIISLPMGGLNTYLTGGVNYVVYGNSQTSGNVGGDVALGISADLGLGLGKTGFEVGYSIVRSKTVSAKGLSVSVSQSIVL
jgi:hypothetical protein